MNTTTLSPPPQPGGIINNAINSTNSPHLNTLLNNDLENEQDPNSAALESSYMQLEASWLIKKEVPIICKRVKRILNRCLELLKPSTLKNDQELKPEENKQQQQQQMSSSIDGSFRRSSIDFKDINYIQVNYEELDDLLQDDEEKEKNKPWGFETEQGSRGTLFIDGWLVESPDIQIKFFKPMRQTPVYKTLINKAHPWRIQQIQNSYNYLNLIQTELDSLILFTESYIPLDSNAILSLRSPFQTSPSSSNISNNNNQNTNNNNSNVNLTTSDLNSSTSGWLPSWTNRHYTQSFPELLSLVESIKKISEWLSLARDEILLPSKSVFPNTLFQSNVLQPPLPFEINVDISISNCELIFTVYELSISSGTGSQLHQQQQQSISNPSTNSQQPSSSSSNINQPQPTQPSLSSSTGDLNTKRRSTITNRALIQNGGSGNTTNPSLSVSSANSPTTNTSQPSISLVNSTGSIPRSSSPDNSHLIESNSNIQPFQTTKGGSLQWVTVLDYTEYRKPIPSLLNTFTLLTNAYGKLAELSEKLLAVSNI